MWRRITIHHTAGVDTGGLQWDDVRRHHVMVNGWSDMGYHWIIERVENAYVAQMGRPAYRMGAHAKGANGGNLGVAFVGNFMEEPPPDAMLEVGADLVAALMVMNGIPSGAIHSHRKVGTTATDCPGDQFPFLKFVGMALGKVEQYRPKGPGAAEP